jgi:hypothetical protein
VLQECRDDVRGEANVVKVNDLGGPGLEGFGGPRNESQQHLLANPGVDELYDITQGLRNLDRFGERRTND